MASLTWSNAPAGVWRYSHRDALLVMFAVAHGLILLAWPAMPVIAIGLWWNSNTIAHNFIHRPFFQNAWINRAFSAFLSVILGIPQTLWRDRHLAHHRGVAWRWRWSGQLPVETAIVISLFTAFIISAPRFFLLAYVPGYLAGLSLCALQGYWEHSAGSPTSHYGRIYNALCFNDGYHAEHHARPATHWTALRDRCKRDAMVSRWPALLRWLDWHPLETLERMVMRSQTLQSFVLARHRHAFQILLPHLDSVRSATIVGGGLFPRTAILLRELLPNAHLTIVDLSERNLNMARAFLGDRVDYRIGRFTPGDTTASDLTVIPLCFTGDRAAIYHGPPSRIVMLHEWMWRRREIGAMVSIALLKRINLIRR